MNRHFMYMIKLPYFVVNANNTSSQYVFHFPELYQEEDCTSVSAIKTNKYPSNET